MAFKVLWFACFTVPSVVTSSVVPAGHHKRSPLSQNHAVEALTFPLLKRQDLPSRNDTSTAASTPATTKQHTSSITHTSTIDQTQTTSDSLKRSAPASATTSRLAQSSSYSSALQQSDSISQPQLTSRTVSQPPPTSAHEAHSSRLKPGSSSPSSSQHHASSQTVDSAIASTIPSSQVFTPSGSSLASSSGILSTQSPISHGASARTSAQVSPPQLTEYTSVIFISSTTMAEIHSTPITSDFGSKIESHVTISAVRPTSPQIESTKESQPFPSTIRRESGTFQHNTEIRSIAPSSTTAGVSHTISVSDLISSTLSAPSTSSFTIDSSSRVDIVPSATLPAIFTSEQLSSSQIQHSLSSGSSTTVVPSGTTGGVLSVVPTVLSSLVLRPSDLSVAIPTSESMAGTPRVAPSSSILILYPTTASGVSHSGNSGTGTLNTSQFIISTTSLLWATTAVNIVSGTVSSLGHTASLPVTNVSTVPVLEPGGSSSRVEMGPTSKSLLDLNPQLSASATLIANATTISITIVASSTASTMSANLGARNTTTLSDAAKTKSSIDSGIQPSGFITDSSRMGSHAPQTTSAQGWTNSTGFASVPTAASSSDTTDLMHDLAASTSQISVTVYSTSSERRWATKTVTVASSPTSTATSSATVSPPVSPPLTSSQTVGVAIAGTTGILIALIAAVFLARRYRAKRSRRSSTGSVYPKVAYLYDPPGHGTDGAADPEEALMSGGASGMPYDTLEQPMSSAYGHRHSTGSMPVRFSDPGNPFRDPEDTPRYSKDFNGRSTYTSAGAVAAVSAVMKGYKAAPQSAPVMTERALAEHTNWPSPTPCPRSPSRRSILSEITSMAYSPMSRSESGASQRQPPSPYGLRANRSLPCVRETTDTDSYRDPFEHDLLLQVDTRTETPDCVTVYAPSTAPTMPLSNNPWASSMVDAQAQHKSYTPSPISPDATLVGSTHFSPARDSQTYTSPFQKQKDNFVSPISPPLGTTHRGWDDIRRYSSEKVVPSIPNFTPPQGHLSSFAVKQRSLPQLRRREYSLDASSSRIHLPLTLKIPGSTGNLPATNTDGVKRPESGLTQSVHSLAGLLQRHKGRNLEFSCAGVK